MQYEIFSSQTDFPYSKDKLKGLAGHFGGTMTPSSLSTP